MPHMSNLPWIQIYMLLLAIVMVIFCNLNYNVTSIHQPAEKNTSSPSKTKKWSW